LSTEIPGVFHNDPELSSFDLDRIFILGESESGELWHKYVSHRNRHLKELRDDEWPSKIVTANPCLYTWSENWNDNDFIPFKSLIKGLGIPDNSLLYVFWMKEIGVKTCWEVFCNNWGNFLYEDEGCILVLPEIDRSVVLSNGRAWVGERGAVS
jgi:hypothetical protein